MSTAISAQTGAGLSDLLERIDAVLYRQMAPVDVLIPYERGDLVALAHTHGFVENEDHLAQGVHLYARLPVQLAGRYSDYWYTSDQEPPAPSETSPH